MNSLGLDIILPPTFNVETGKFDDPKLLDEFGVPLNEADMDIFELARLRGTSVHGLKEFYEAEESAKQNQQI